MCHIKTCYLAIWYFISCIDTYITAGIVNLDMASLLIAIAIVFWNMSANNYSIEFNNYHLAIAMNM